MKIGDCVVRISHNKDIIFRIYDIRNDIAILAGIYVRLIADAKLDDLEVIDDEILSRAEDEEYSYYNNIVSSIKRDSREVNGKILHLDSDVGYLRKCLQFYKDNNIYAYGVCYKEEQMADNINDLVLKIRPDVIVITGHDSYNRKGLDNLDNYSHTSDYIKTIKKVREQFSLDDIFIYAGACGSNFEALIASGANFASSVNRDNIDAYDPAIVAYIAATTRITNLISLDKFKKLSKSANKVVGGIDSYGKMRVVI